MIQSTEKASAFIKQMAIDLNFDDVGITGAEETPFVKYFEESLLKKRLDLLII